jgi:hypothetical protein
MSHESDEWSSSERGEETFSFDWVDFIMCVGAAMLILMGLIRFVA